MYAKGLSKCGLFSSLSQDMLTYGKSISKEQKENIINVMTNEFPAGSGKKTYAQCVFIEKEGNDCLLKLIKTRLLEILRG